MLFFYRVLRVGSLAILTYDRSSSQYFGFIYLTFSDFLVVHFFSRLSQMFFLNFPPCLCPNSLHVLAQIHFMSLPKFTSCPCPNSLHVLLLAQFPSCLGPKFLLFLHIPPFLSFISSLIFLHVLPKSQLCHSQFSCTSYPVLPNYPQCLSPIIHHVLS